MQEKQPIIYAKVISPVKINGKKSNWISFRSPIDTDYILENNESTFKKGKSLEYVDIDGGILSLYMQIGSAMYSDIYFPCSTEFHQEKPIDIEPIFIDSEDGLLSYKNSFAELLKKDKELWDKALSKSGVENKLDSNNDYKVKGEINFEFDWNKLEEGLSSYKAQEERIGYFSGNEVKKKPINKLKDDNEKQSTPYARKEDHRRGIEKKENIQIL